MLKYILNQSLAHPKLVLLGTAVVMAIGLQITRNMELDVFPDLTAPTVVVMTESHGLSAEEVEQLVTYPLETALNGTPSIRRLRSSSSQGFSTIWVEFDWDIDVYLARQLVSERLSSVRTALPDAVDAPVMAPVSSIMGEVMIVVLESESKSPQELRSLADWQVRPRLMAVQGVANVSVLGGLVSQLEVQVDQAKLLHHRASLSEVIESAQEAADGAAGGGVFDERGNQYAIRVAGRARSVDDIASAPLVHHTGLRLEDVAEVQWHHADPLGSASCNENDAVVLTVTKQPGVNTLNLTTELDEALSAMKSQLPQGVSLRSDVFRQSDFIEASISNLQRTLLEGAFFVTLVLLLFLMNWRTTLISVLAIPLSLMASIMVLWALGYELNTMSLGGMAIAIGALVDDAIIDVENVYRRLRQRKGEPILVVVRDASLEIRSSIVVATFIILVSFVPLFFLSGMEGRLLQPLGIAFIASVLTSLVVAITVTPVLCSMLLTKEHAERDGEGVTRVEAALRSWYVALLARTLNRPKTVVALASTMTVLAMILFTRLGSSFLPPFNEGSLVVSTVGPPGMSLEETNRVGRMAERLLLEMPEVDVVSRRSGRAELDEHAQGVNSSEIDAPFTLRDGKTAGAFFDEVRERLSVLPGVNVSLGQPISHRIDHMLSGTRANIAVKVFGDDLNVLRDVNLELVAAFEQLPQLTDVAPEPQIEVPEVKIIPRDDMLAAHGLTRSDLAHFVELGLGGAHVGEVYLGTRERRPLVVRLAEQDRTRLEELNELTLDVPGGARVPLGDVATIQSVSAAYAVSRENVERKSVIAVNVAEGTDLAGAVEAIQQALAAFELPEGVRVEIGGQYESVQTANRLLVVTALLALLAIFGLLYWEFQTWKLAGLVLANLPLALIGGIGAIAVTSGVVNIASIIGLISLFGIAARNGILLISRYEDLRKAKGGFDEAMLTKGAVDRLNPIVMTALSTAMALVPLALQAGESGSEIQSPMAVVILGGLISATVLNLFVMPAMYSLLSQPAVASGK